MFVQDQLSENSKYVDFFSLRSILEAKAFYSPQQSWGLFLRLSKSIRKKGHLPVPLYDRLGRQAVDAFAAAFLQSTSNFFYPQPASLVGQHTDTIRFFFKKANACCRFAYLHKKRTPNLGNVMIFCFSLYFYFICLDRGLFPM